MQLRYPPNLKVAAHQSRTNYLATDCINIMGYFNKNNHLFKNKIINEFNVNHQNLF